MRPFHRKLGAFFAPLLALTALTGLLWAYAPYLYWKEGYLKKKSAAETIEWRDVRVTPAQAAGATDAPASVILKKEAGKTFYLVSPSGKSAVERVVDAATGETLSPIGDEWARGIAQGYAPVGARITAVKRVSSYKHRNGKTVVPSAVEVRFDDPDRTVIWLNADTAAIVEETSRKRAFHFFVMKLHSLSFFGTHKELVVIPGVGLLGLLTTGLILLKRQSGRRA